MLIISLTLGLSLGDLNLRCHCTSTSSNASDIEITIQRYEKCQPLQSVSSSVIPLIITPLSLTRKGAKGSCIY